MNHQRLFLSFSTSYKYRFVQGFVRALQRINRQKPTSVLYSTSPREICKRYLKVKSAADASMASAVGLRRAWSRALLHRIRQQQRNNINFGKKCYKNCSLRKTSTFTMKKKNYNLEAGCEKERYSSEKDNKEKINNNNNGIVNWKANELRKLVPGGEDMDMCNLLDETAHYIKCLATQVKLMRRIADFASASVI